MQVTLELIDSVRNLSFDEALRYLVGTLYPEVLDPLRVPGVVLACNPTQMIASSVLAAP